MLLRIAKTLRRLRKDSSGNALMLVAVGVPMLIGGAGAAVDIAQWYAWKRELQQATDQGALAAAWALSNPNSRTSYTTRGTQDYNNNLALTRGFASTPTFQLASYANGSNNSVIVRATATRALPFSSFITGSAVTIGVSSQASFQAGQNYTACLIAVGDSGTTFSIGGNANVQARCGLAALSCSDDAITIDGSATVVTDSIATCGTASVPAANESVLTEKVTGLTDTFSDLTPPTDDTERTIPPCQSTKENKTRQATFQPGTYKETGLKVQCNSVFNKGIYVIEGGILDLTANFTVTGSNVMFVLRNGAQLRLGGMGNSNLLTLTPMQAADFLPRYSPTLANRYANMLIFEDRNSPPPTQDHIINGNSSSMFQGTIYLPKGTARLNGTTSISSSCLQISARRINVLGNAYLDTKCVTNQTNSAGTSIAKVNLVA